MGGWSRVKVCSLDAPLALNLHIRQTYYPEVLMKKLDTIRRVQEMEEMP
jgi:hypothetical protein